MDITTLNKGNVFIYEKQLCVLDVPEDSSQRQEARGHILFGDNPNGFIGFVRPEEVFPVPLTQELLDRIEYDINDHTGNFTPTLENPNPGATNTSLVFNISIGLTKDDGTRISYLHELQNHCNGKNIGVNLHKLRNWDGFLTSMI